MRIMAVSLGLWAGKLAELIDCVSRRDINQRIACNVWSKAFNGASSTPGPAVCTSPAGQAAGSIVATSLTPTDGPAMLATRTAH